ncbi:DUF2313 domain-containing protein [Candidatus Pacearchaeota archaeon]|nr:DUF2313 domain-containing protein [Candidatus Pacearchaeota archaeon]
MFTLGGKNFKPNTEEENTQALADLLPQGVAWEAKNIEGSNMYKLLTSMSKEFVRVQEKINEFVIEHRPETTTNLIEEWEAAVGIPDSCFSNTVSIDLRRKQVVAKLAKMNVQTAQDFIDLAAYFGYRVIIRNGATGSVLPVTLPFALGSYNFLLNTILVKFVDLDKPNNIFTMTFPFTFGPTSNIIICIFNKLKPVTAEIIFSYRDQ